MVNTSNVRASSRPSVVALSECCAASWLTLTAEQSDGKNARWKAGRPRISELFVRKECRLLCLRGKQGPQLLGTCELTNQRGRRRTRVVTVTIVHRTSPGYALTVRTEGPGCQKHVLTRKSCLWRNKGCRRKYHHQKCAWQKMRPDKSVESMRKDLKRGNEEVTNMQTVARPRGYREVTKRVAASSPSP